MPSLAYGSNRIRREKQKRHLLSSAQSIAINNLLQTLIERPMYETTPRSSVCAERRATAQPHCRNWVRKNSTIDPEQKGV